MAKCLLTHTISSNTRNNASKFAYNSIQGHWHSEFCISYYADTSLLRWSMTQGSLMDPRSLAARYAKTSVLKRGILGCGVLTGGSQNTLVIPDLHFPYEHIDTLDFLCAVYNKYHCTSVICTGDLMDHHHPSVHTAEPDAYSPEEEFRITQEKCLTLQGIFPKMIISYGNHDTRFARVGKTVSMPTSIVSDLNKVYELKNTWSWKDHHTFDDKGSMPHLIPMLINKRHRWDKKVT